MQRSFFPVSVMFWVVFGGGAGGVIIGFFWF